MLGSKIVNIFSWNMLFSQKGPLMTTPEDSSLIKMRKALGIGQSEMAKRMGLSLRPYQELESKARSVRFRHILLAESVALDIAIEKENLELVPANVRKKLVKLALMLVQQNLKERPLRIAESILGQTGFVSPASVRQSDTVRTKMVKRWY